MGIHPPGYVASIVAFAFGLAASSFCPAILLGIFSTRINREGVIAGMIAGIGFTSIYIIGFKFLDWDTSHYIWGISPEGIGTLGMLINFAIAMTVSAFTPPPPPEVQRLVEEIRVPK